MNANVKPPQTSTISPGFHFLRHLLSVVILGFHSYVLTFGGTGNLGYMKGALLATAGHLTTKQFVIELMRPGLFALVGMFFALSGYLVMGSALRTRNLRQFFTLRGLRILPALCTEVALSAFILGPVVTSLSPHDYFGRAETYTYFGNIVGYIQYSLPGVFTTNPIANTVNVNLWTLHAEFFCYLLIGALMATGILYKNRVMTVLVTATVLLSAIAVSIPQLGLSDRYDTTHFESWFLVVMFAVGMLFCLHKAIIPISGAICAVCGIVYFGLMISGVCDALAAVLLTYVMVYLGTCRFTWFDRIVKDDCSYGIYLYGYPITQTVVYLLLDRIQGIPSVPRLMIVMTLSIAFTFCFALFSWRKVEKPFLKLKAVLLPPRPREVVFTPADAAPSQVGAS